MWKAYIIVSGLDRDRAGMMQSLQIFVKVWRDSGRSAAFGHVKAKITANLFGQTYSVAKLVELAKVHLEVGRVSVAKQLLGYALQENAKNFDVLEVLARVAEKESRWNEVIRLRKYLVSEGGVVGAHQLNKLASAHIAAGEYKNGVKVLDQVLSFTPDVTEVLIEKAHASAKFDDVIFTNTVAYISSRGLSVPPADCLRFGRKFTILKQHDEAEKWLHVVLNSKEISALEKLSMAKMIYALGEHEVALPVFNALAKEVVPNFPYEELDEYVGHIEYNQANYVDAIVCYKAAISNSSESAMVYKRLVLSYLSLGVFSEAKQWLLRADKKLPQDVIIVPIRPRVFFQNGDVDKGKVCVEEFKGMSYPYSVWKELGVHLDKSASPSECRRYWKATIRNFPQEASSYAKLIRAQYRSHQPIESLLETAEILDNIAPKNPQGILFVARTYSRNGANEEARQVYSTGTKKIPSYMPFWKGIIQCCVKADDSSEAEQYLRAATTHIDVDEWRGQHQLADLLYTLEHFEKSDALYEKVICIKPHAFEIRQQYVSGLLRRGQYGQALVHVIYLYENYPQNKSVGLMYEQCQSAILYARNGGDALSDDKLKALVLPESSLDWLFKNAPQAYTFDPCGKILNVSSTLRPGGAERQAMLTIMGLNTFSHTFSQIDMLVETLDVNRGADFFASRIKVLGQDIGVLEDTLTSYSEGRFLDENPDAVFMMRYMRSMPQEVQKFAVPLFVEFSVRRPDVVHLWQDRLGVCGLLAALGAGVPKIVIGTRSLRPDARRRYRRYIKPIYQFMARRYPNRCVLLNNSYSGALDYEEWLGLEKGHVKVVHNGLNVEVVHESSRMLPSLKSIRSELGIPEGTFILGSVGRFSVEKRPQLWVDTALEIAKLRTDVHFLIVGEGVLRRRVMQSIENTDYKERFYFVGAKSPVEPWIAAMDMLMLTSSREGLPNVLLEAQCLGVPVATTAVGGAAEALQEGETGFVFSVENAKEMAFQLLSFVEHTDAYFEKKEKAQEWAEKSFSIEEMIRKTLDIYNG